MASLVTIENDVLGSLAQSDEAVALLPHVLSGIRAARKNPELGSGCGRCRDNASTELQAAYSRAKMTVSNLPQEDLDTLKKLLHTTAIRVAVVGAGDRVTVRTL